MFLMTFTIIQFAVTMQFIIMVAGWTQALPTLTLRYWAYRLMTNRTCAFIIDLIISCIIGWFTGDGMTSGFTNLLSGLIAAAVSPYVLEWKYKFSKLEAEYEAYLAKRKENNPFNRIKNHFRRKQAA
jgi:hypothetical protein